MRGFTEKQAKFENEAQMEPSAKKNRLDSRITSIVTLDNDTTVEVFKYLKYCGLAKTSLVSKRFCDLIRTHRNKLALLYVDYIGIVRHTLALLDVKSINMELTDIFRNPTSIEIFDKDLSPEYNDWVIHNGYSKQIPFEDQSAGMQSTQYERKVYWLTAHADFKDLTPAFERKWFSMKEMQNFFATIELSHENWPVFQHFLRLLTDPLIFIRSMGLPAQKDALTLLTGAINPEYGRLQCHKLTVSLEDNTHNFTSWIKGHVQCFKIDIINSSGLNHDDEFFLNHDDEFVDFFMTGGNCTSEVEVNFYDPCKAIGNFVQKFMDLKSGDENKVVGTIVCHPHWNVNMDAFNRNYADFVIEGNINQTRGLSNLVFEFVNNDIEKKLRLSISFGYRTTEFTLKVTNF